MEISRRNFLKTASIGASLMVASGWSPFSYAQNAQVRIGAIGTGGQGSFHLREGIARSAAAGLYLVATCDVYTPHLEGGWREAGGPARESLEPDKRLRKYMNYHEMLEKEQLDGVVVTTPLSTHYQIVMDSLDAGKHVFVEKCMCYTMEQCRDVVTKSNATGKIVQVGHQRRYNPRYNHAVKMAREDGVLGRINHIDAQWHRNNDWRRAVPNRELTPEEKQFIKTDLEHHINWRLYWETSDGLMTELGAHQIDVAAWFLDAWPTKVSGYGGIDYWRDGRECPDNVNCILEFEMTPNKAGYKAIKPGKTKFQDEFKGPDGEPACNQPYKVVMCYSSITGNANKGAAEFIQGDEGTFELTEADCKFYREANSNVKWFDGARKDAADANAVLITSGSSLLLSNKANKTAEHIIINMDKTPDQIQFESFTNDIQTNGIPKANVMVGLRSALCALAATRSIREGHEVVIPPEWYTFDFPTDKWDPSGPKSYTEYGPAERKPAAAES
jgi:predicted dehydrogenase